MTQLLVRSGLHALGCSLPAVMQLAEKSKLNFTQANKITFFLAEIICGHSTVTLLLARAVAV
jgi:hypothetical protein